MVRVELDNKIFLYKNNNCLNFLLKIQSIENILIDKNVWEVSCKSNILDTDFTLDKKVLYLKSISCDLTKIRDKSNPESKKYYKEIYNLKHDINTYAFDFVKNYVDSLELNIKGLQDWAICIQKESNNFHNNIDRSGSKNKYTVVIALNDDYTGGEFYFENRVGNEPIRMSFGDVLIYPSNNNYRHKEAEVTSGVKYSAVGYF